MTTNELIAYYQNLLIVQYEGQPKARTVIAAYVSQVIAEQIISQVEDGFDLEKAIGKQLDILGEYRGADRGYFGVVITHTYWTMPFYADADADTRLGWPLYGQAPIKWYWLSYTEAVEPEYFLNDDEMRRLIKLRTLMQASDNSLESINQALYDVFQGTVVARDNRNMTMDYIHLKTDIDMLWPIAQASRSLIHPAGVSVSYLEQNIMVGYYSLQYYGRPSDPDFIGLGRYGAPKTGILLRYK